MIPVTAKPEPSSFDAKVRKPGARWLKKQRIAPASPIPKGVTAPPHWRECLDDLHAAYGGVCAYLCVYVERTTGGASVDHFIAKSRLAGQTYEWSNYRLACATMNARKRDYTTVLDPFDVKPGSFHLELVSGRVYANPACSASDRARVEATIRRLGLDQGDCREMRTRRYSDYLDARGANRNLALEDQLMRYFPFIWFEADRQGLL